MHVADIYDPDHLFEAMLPMLLMLPPRTSMCHSLTERSLDADRNETASGATERPNSRTIQKRDANKELKLKMHFENDGENITATRPRLVLQ